MKDFVALMTSAGRRMTKVEERSFFDLMKMHVDKYLAAGGIPVPKTHEILHVAWNCRKFGNPRYYSTYEDESANGAAKKQCQRSHPLRFAEAFWDRYFVVEIAQRAVVG